MAGWEENIGILGRFFLGVVGGLVFIIVDKKKERITQKGNTMSQKGVRYGEGNQGFDGRIQWNRGCDQVINFQKMKCKV